MGDPASFFLSLHVFVCEKINKSGVISVQVIYKINGRSKLVKTIGSSRDKLAIAQLVQQGQEFIESFAGQQSFYFSDENSLFKSVFQSITSHTEIGTELILG